MGMLDNTQIPEAVFGKFVKDTAFRSQLLDPGQDLSELLDQEGIYISETGLLELSDLIARLDEEVPQSILTFLEDEQENFAPG
jgi:hypothetical protein